ncbi:MAG: tetratricopeptide repeat protein [Elusimicrobia bacterium]|nr:tetratricopeptide repeat protein [Elusimicrobiota bacterium]
MNFILPLLLSLTLFLDPIFPDIQIIRPKLLVIELGLFCLLFAWLIRTIQQGKIEIRKTNLNFPIIIYILYISIAYLLSENKSVAFNEFKRMLICSSIYFLSCNILGKDCEKNKTLRNTILVSLIAGSSIALLYGFLQHFGDIHLAKFVFSVPQMGRAASTFGNPIFFAVHLVFFLPILLGFFFYLNQNKKRSLLIFVSKLVVAAIFIIGLFTLYFTQTRAAWIGFFISILLFIILMIKSTKLKIIFISISIFLGVIFAILTHDVWLRQQAHLLIWRDTLSMWMHSPLFGTGPGTFHINFPKFASQDLLAIWPQSQRIINDAHNEYVQLLAETGIIGFGIFFWILFSFFRPGLKTFNQNRNSNEAYILAGLLCSAAGVLIQNIGSVDMRFIISAFYLFLVIGLLYSFENSAYIIPLNLKKNAKITLMILSLFIFGIIGLDKKPKIHFVSLLHYDFSANKLDIQPLPEGTGLLPLILRPYLAQKLLSREVDFFDEKLFEPIKTLDELLELQKKYPNETKIYEKLAWSYSKERNFPKAIECYEKALQINPNLPGVYNNLGNVLFYVNNRKDSIECYKKSIEIKPGQPDAHLNLGILLYLDGKLEESAKHFDFVLKKDPGNEKAIVYLKRMRE